LVLEHCVLPSLASTVLLLQTVNRHEFCLYLVVFRLKSEFLGFYQSEFGPEHVEDIRHHVEDGPELVSQAQHNIILEIIGLHPCESHEEHLEADHEILLISKRYFEIVHDLLVVVDVSLVVEAGQDAVLEEHHPHFLPVGEEHGEVEGGELEVGVVGTQLVLHRRVVQTHVVERDVGGEGSKPVDVGVDFVVDYEVPVAVVSALDLEVRVEQSKYDRCDDFYDYVL
jgi:hypothetical protein